MKGPVKKEDVKKDVSVKKETKDKKLKAKGILLHSWLNKNDQITSAEEAKAACKTRKRKERQESISSICQERKVIRSNSEERPHSRRHLEKENIRRVSSSEDLHFQNVKNKKKNSSRENLDVSENNVSEECEHEKRRSHERFAKPLTLKCKKTYPKKPKGKSFHKAKCKLDEKYSHHETIDIEIHLQDSKIRRDRSPSPLRTVSPSSFDLSTLHQQVDDSEPLPSCSNRIDNDTVPSLSIVPNRLLSSPRNSIIATHCIYLDPDASYNNVRKTLNPVEQRQVKVGKQLNAVKKKIKRYENDFFVKHGCKPSHFDKINDSSIKKFYMDFTKLKKEYKLLQESGIKYALNSARNSEEFSEMEGSYKMSLKEIIAEIELKLQVKRESSKRSDLIEDMTPDQLLEEKVAVQKALLHLENRYGRPIGKEDRDCVRPLYDRYRNLKRMVCKASMGPPTLNDLETIHEDETIHFVIDATKSTETPTEKTSTLGTVTDSDTDVSLNENLHFMNQTELRQQLNAATEEKKVLKRAIKEYEFSVQQKTGKMVQKEDKLQIDQLYKNYKSVKSKLRLLDALIAKQN
ncbi:hypothetical protein WA026_022086 [Henosepilachna vigintioctopunctata]|uniref:FAM13A-like domain-containing protein n=1 Tax=Henosepilachna vigintioctopunctata TaxID=420089 RepID=A0AAW1UF18_9CUCU